MRVRVACGPMQGRPAALREYRGGRRASSLREYSWYSWCVRLSLPCLSKQSQLQHLGLLPVLRKVTHLLHCVGQTPPSSCSSCCGSLASFTALGSTPGRVRSRATTSKWPLRAASCSGVLPCCSAVCGRQAEASRDSFSSTLPQLLADSRALAPRASLAGARRAWRLLACGPGAPPR